MEMINETENSEKNQNKNFGKVKTWIKKHETGIKAACVITLVAAGAALLYSNRNTVRMTLPKPKKLPLVAATPEVVTEPIQSVLPTVAPNPVLKETIVRLHPRTLSGGRHPSQEKLAQAAALGLSLAENQTFVSEHLRHYAA